MPCLEESRQMLNCLSSGIILINATREIVLTNQTAKSMFGQDIEGQDFVHAVRHPECLKLVNRILLGRKQIAEKVMSLPGQADAIYQITATQLAQNRDDEAAALISFEDVSHIREAEQMRSDFVANVSHELRSPLTVLSGFIETLKDMPAGEDAQKQEFLEIMENEAGRMNRLIEDLLSLSKLEAREHIQPSDTINISKLLPKVISSLSAQLKSERKTIEIINELKTDAIIPGDKDQLTQVFYNLVENAIKYAAANTLISIRLSMTNRAWSPHGDVLAIAITDQGAGIAKKHIPRLTERFYRVDKGRSRDVGGTGLGLAIVKHIVNRHRGRMMIQSIQDQGSTFTVMLPM